MKRCRQSESLVEYSVTVGRPPAGAEAARFLRDSRDTRRVSPRPMLYCDRVRSDSSSCAAHNSIMSAIEDGEEASRGAAYIGNQYSAHPHQKGSVRHEAFMYAARLALHATRWNDGPGAFGALDGTGGLRRLLQTLPFLPISA